MGTPWSGPRHRSWASDTVITGGILLALIVTTSLIDALVGEPPTYLVGLLGTAAGAFFGAIGSDKSKREREIERRSTAASRQAGRAERKADLVAEVASEEHPEMTERLEQLHADEEERRL